MNITVPRFVSAAPTYVALLQEQASRRQDARLYTFLVDGEDEEAFLTFHQLDEQARAIGAMLQAYGAAGERALLLYPPGLEFVAAFMGCLYGGIVAVPAYPPEPARLNRTLPRLQAIIADAQVKIVLTTSLIASMAESFFSQAPDLAELLWLPTDEVALELAGQWTTPPIDGQSVAFLQYTSGSTSAPKGVMVTHQNLLHNQWLAAQACQTSPETVIVGWLPLYHDMGLIGQLLHSIYDGGQTVFMSPLAFLQRPYRWLKAISRYRGNLNTAPNFAYDLCVRKITEEQKATLDLSSWRRGLNGAEPVRRETLEAFARAFEPCGFRLHHFMPCFGLAEATLIVSCTTGEAPPAVRHLDAAQLEQNRVQAQLEPGPGTRSFVSCGPVMGDQRLAIVDPESCLEVSDQQVGEIWLKGLSVASGYWRRPEETAQTFGATLADTGEGPFLRTGDLGFVQDGELYVTGRRKDLIIIRGRNHYPQDIERTAEVCHPDLRKGCSAAFSVEVDGEEQLGLVIEVDRRFKVGGELKPDVDAIADAIRQRVVAQHELRLHHLLLLKAGSIPKTSSGKIQRHACKLGMVRGGLEVVGESNFGSSLARLTTPSSTHLVENKNVSVDEPSVGPTESTKPSRPTEAASRAVPAPAKAAGSSHQARAIRDWLVAQLAERLRIPASELDVRQPFTRYGLDSKEAVSLSGDLELFLGRRVAPTLMYEYPSVEALSRHLGGEEAWIPAAERSPVAGPTDSAARGEAGTHTAPTERDARSGSTAAGAQDSAGPSALPRPIAIVGIGCRLPGKVSTPAAFWDLLKNGVDAIQEVPKSRWDADALFDPDTAAPGKVTTRFGGFVEDVDRFDAAFFGISPREAQRLDPQQRLLMEVAWEALEDAGLLPSSLARTQTAVFVGISSADYSHLQLHDPQLSDAYLNTGNAFCVAANRISYFLDLRGPSLALDTACSSSLVAIHLACQSIRRGESSLALAGGVSVLLSPDITVGFSKGGYMAPDGRCKAFDARANGYVRSEGAGLVVLKPLDRALADGDPIYAVIRGSAVNQDGRSNGLTAPNREAQEAVLEEAYRQAGVSPAEVQYVEAHGTGTPLGDPIEARALATVLGKGRAEAHKLWLGSVKTNLGHLEAAAGVTGLIKVALSLKARQIPASLHFEKPNPLIPFDELPLRVARNLEPWPSVSRPLAGVSSFGFGGTNAHVVLEAAPERVTAQEGVAVAGPLADADMPRHEPVPTGLPLLLISAQQEEGLKDLAPKYAQLLANPTVSVEAVCAGAALHRQHLEYRLAVTGEDRAGLVERLEAYAQGETRPGLVVARRGLSRERKLVFVFPGQGSQWLGMARDLLQQNAAFRASMEACEETFRAYVDWSLLDALAADEASSPLERIDVLQPTLFAIQVSLAAAWRAVGVVPQAVVGHSMGEAAAAHVAGILSLSDAARIICRRSRLMRKLSGQGMMAVVELSLEEAGKAIVGLEDKLSIAVSNSPTSTVLSGDPEVLKRLLDSLLARDIFCRPIKVDVASHSPQMDPLREDLLEALQGLQPARGQIPFFSTVEGRYVDGSSLGEGYWVRNLRQPVLFSTAIRALRGEGHDLFVEISPHPILMGAVQQCLKHADQDGAALPSLRRSESGPLVLAETLGALHNYGYPLDLSMLFSAATSRVDLPRYPWQRDRHWVPEGGRETTGSVGRTRRASSHPLLTDHQALSSQAGTHLWEFELSLTAQPWLADHQVQGAAVAPAALYAELALAGAREAFGRGIHALEQLRFEQALFLEDTPRTLQLVMTSSGPGLSSFRLASLTSGQGERADAWTLHASGAVRLAQGPADAVPMSEETPGQLKVRCPQAVTGPEHYAGLASRGLEYGPAFQGVEKIWRRDGEAIAQLRLTEGAGSAGGYRIHPALLDACFQVLAAAIPEEISQVAGETWLPVGLKSFTVHAAPVERPWAHARLTASAGEGTEGLEGDLFLLDDRGECLVEARGLRLQRLEASQEGVEEALRNWLYVRRWVPQDLADPGTEARPVGDWLIFADRAGLGARLAEQLEAKGARVQQVYVGRAGVAGPGTAIQLEADWEGAYPELLRTQYGQQGPRGVIFLWGQDDTDSPSASRQATVWALYAVKALVGAGWSSPPRLWLVTRGAQSVGTETSRQAIFQAPLWGFGATVANEHPELACSLLDLSGDEGVAEQQATLRELLSGGKENQIVLRGVARYVARMLRADQQTADTARALAPAAGRAFRLKIDAPGRLDSLALHAISRGTPGPDEVEIEVVAAGLNFKDVLTAMGLRPDQATGTADLLGAECSGRVTAVGRGVTDLKVGDEVVGVAPASFSSHVLTLRSYVAKKPAHLSFEEAVAIPIPYMTAYYALHTLGRIQPGEKVLIHSATGGTGLAAVQVAQAVGAEIFATAGSPRKREYLKSLGIQHVFDSRSLAFADEIRAVTDGQGVDLVLNSLTGEALVKSLECLAPHGRFLEIGKRDIYANTSLGLSPFRRSLTYAAIDLARMLDEKRTQCAELLAEVVAGFERKVYWAPPLTVFPISEAEQAFRLMAQAGHMGKIALRLEDPAVQLVAEEEAQTPAIRPEGTYLISGGLGGIGLGLARWLMRQGAQHFVLLGRRAPEGKAARAVEGLRKAGAKVMVGLADVGRAEEVAGVLAQARDSLPPLAGVIHCAAVLEDGIILQQDAGHYNKVMTPKVDGAWVLHELTKDLPLSLFLLFSSAAAWLGSPGQSSYAAGNAFLDALAAWRRSQGLPAHSHSWGPWSEIGLAARADRAGRLAARGLGSITPRQGFALLGRLLKLEPPLLGILPIDWPVWLAAYPDVAASPLLSSLAAEASGGKGRAAAGSNSVIRGELAKAGVEERPAILARYLRDQVARVMGMSPARVDLDLGLRNLGLDSLMSIELKNRLEADVGVSLPMVKLIQGPSVNQLAKVVAELLGNLPAPVESAEGGGEEDGEAMEPSEVGGGALVLASTQAVTAGVVEDADGGALVSLTDAVLYRTISRLQWWMLNLTLRYHTVEFSCEEDALELTRLKEVPRIYISWHGRLVGGALLARMCGGADILTMPRSGWGDEGIVQRNLRRALFHNMDRYGLHAIELPVDGSPEPVLEEIARRVSEGHSVLMTADSARGGAFVAQLGGILAAARAGVELVPYAFSSTRAVRINPFWDNFLLPMPLTTIYLRLGRPMRFARHLDTEGLEQARAQLTVALNRLTHVTDDMAGRRPEYRLRNPEDFGRSRR